MYFSCTLITAVLAFAWMELFSKPSVFVLALLYEFNRVYASLLPACISSTIKNMRTIGVQLGNESVHFGVRGSDRVVHCRGPDFSGLFLGQTAGSAFDYAFSGIDCSDSILLTGIKLAVGRGRMSATNVQEGIFILHMSSTNCILKLIFTDSNYM